METTLAETADHAIFVTEGRGDTLIVTPRGERAGFSEVDFSVELKRVQQLLDTPRFANIIIDLSQANYFGSEMIGVINGLLDQARRNGGEGGVCDVSPDMMEGLKIMNLDNYWPLYNSRSHAVNDIVSESVAQMTSRFALRRVGVFAAVGIVVIGIAWAGSSLYKSFTPRAGENLFWELESIHDEAIDLRQYGERSAWPDSARALNRKIGGVSSQFDQTAMLASYKDALNAYAASLRSLLQDRTPNDALFRSASAARARTQAVFDGRAVARVVERPDKADATKESGEEGAEGGPAGPGDADATEPVTATKSVE